MITREMIYDDAAELDVDPAAVLAVASVESNGGGFLPDGRPTILFEAHIFHNLTGGRLDTSHPNISSPVWDRSLYKGGAAEHDRLFEALQLDAEAAFKSASWGAFQIMGFNHKACGFPTVTAFCDAMRRDLNSQTAAFTAFIKANPAMHRALKAQDWKTFARLYNGPGAVASYSAKIADAYAKYVGEARPKEGPPIPVADPALKAKPAIASKTVIGIATSAASDAAVVAQNAQPTIDAINTTTDAITQAKTAMDGLKEALSILQNGHVLTFVLSAIVLGVLVYLGVRYINKTRTGDVVVR